MQTTQEQKVQFLNIRTKRIIVLVLSALLLLSSVYCLLRFGFGIDILDRSGLVVESGSVRYLNYSGRAKTGWQYIDGKLHYFNPKSGEMASGWQEIDGSRYYFDSVGVRATGWQELDDQIYYLDAAGKMVTGWQTIEESSYYFDQDGAMRTGWQMRDGKRSYFAQDGVALTGWQKLAGKLYYFDDEGFAVTGWQELDSVRYRFAEDGAAVTGWYEDETGKYFFDMDSHPYSGWLDWEEQTYYCNSDGTLYTGWMTEDQDRYYFKPDGTMTKGEIIIDGVSYFFTSKGKYVLMCNPWHAVPEDYQLQLAMVNGYQFDSTAQYALMKMLDDCYAAGYVCTINNTYRSKSTQQYMWDRSVANYMAAGMTKAQAEAETGKTTAIPGHSEHQTGLAVDLNGSQAVYDWLGEHCWEYGFILRYPDDKIDITGIIYEPWHFRYVGTELSLEIRDLGGITLEEYIDSLTPEEIPVVNTQPAE